MTEELKACRWCENEQQQLKAEMKVLISYLEDGHDDWALDKLKAWFKYL